MTSSLQRGKTQYNMVMCHPDDGPFESWTAEGSADKMRADFDDWEPRYVYFTSRYHHTHQFHITGYKSCYGWFPVR